MRHSPSEPRVLLVHIYDVTSERTRLRVQSLKDRMSDGTIDVNSRQIDKTRKLLELCRTHLHVILE